MAWEYTNIHSPLIITCKWEHKSEVAGCDRPRALPLHCMCPRVCLCLRSLPEGSQGAVRLKRAPGLFKPAYSDMKVFCCHTLLFVLSSLSEGNPDGHRLAHFRQLLQGDPSCSQARREI